jgi:hypothetical protein
MAPDPGPLANDGEDASEECSGTSFGHLKLSGAPRGLPFAAGKNSAPRARRPQPRRNAGQSAGAGSKCPVVGEGRVRLRPTRPNRLRQLAVVKRQPPGHPCKGFNRLKGRRRWGCNPVLISTPLPAGARRPGPPPRNCLRRLAPVGPDSTLLTPKGWFHTSRQCRIANVAALSGLTVAWRRVFRGAGSRGSCGRRRQSPRRVFCHFSGT